MQRTYKNHIEVGERLLELGLPEPLLRQAVTAGLLGWLSCTENHPPSFRGINAWAETVRGLREIFLPRGWQRLNDRNLPLTVNLSTRTAITASSGDEFTGIEGASPRTRNPKGITTKEKVEANAEQLGLFSYMTESEEEAKEFIEEVAKWDTWLLLSYRDYAARVVRCELSRPVGIGTDGRVDGWYERIILGSIPFDGDEVTLAGGGGDDGNDADGSVEFGNGSDAIDVEVKRRA
jgi:hypothetical protein